MCCIGIVTFNPEIDNLISFIKEILIQKKFLIIVDNNSANKEILKDRIESLKNPNRFIFLENNRNYGIAHALNQIMKEAKRLEFKGVLLLDQDSVFPISKLYEMSCHLKSEVGIVSPVIMQKGTKKYILHKKGKGIEKINTCITSGSLTSVKAWKEVGGFDEKLFIDGVDFDFCKRLIMHGFLILKDNYIEMEHELGVYKSKKVLIWRLNYSWHSKMRTYYIVRNIVYMERKYKDIGVFLTIIRLIKQLCMILILLDEKKERILIFKSAIKDGLKMDICKNGIVER